MHMAVSVYSHHLFRPELVMGHSVADNVIYSHVLIGFLQPGSER